MESSAALTRALLTAGVWAAASYVLAMVGGVQADLAAVATDAGVMGASSLASDTLHSTLNMAPTGMTAALATGGFFAAGQRLLRGDENYVSNVVAGAASDMLVERVAIATGM